MLRSRARYLFDPNTKTACQKAVRKFPIPVVHSVRSSINHLLQLTGIPKLSSLVAEEVPPSFPILKSQDPGFYRSDSIDHPFSSEPRWLISVRISPRSCVWRHLNMPRFDPPCPPFLRRGFSAAETSIHIRVQIRLSEES